MLPLRKMPTTVRAGIKVLLTRIIHGGHQVWMRRTVLAGLTADIRGGF